MRHIGCRDFKNPCSTGQLTPGERGRRNIGRIRFEGHHPILHYFLEQQFIPCFNARRDGYAILRAKNKRSMKTQGIIHQFKPSSLQVGHHHHMLCQTRKHSRVCRFRLLRRSPSNLCLEPLIEDNINVVRPIKRCVSSD